MIPFTVLEYSLDMMSSYSVTSCVCLSRRAFSSGVRGSSSLMSAGSMPTLSRAFSIRPVVSEISTSRRADLYVFRAVSLIRDHFWYSSAYSAGWML